MITSDDLRNVFIFDGLSDDDLAWLTERCEDIRLTDGDVLTQQGEGADALFVILEGTLETSRREEGHVTGTYVNRAGELSGQLPFSHMETWWGTSHAVAPARVARLGANHFPEMLRRMPLLGTRLFHLASDCSRLTTWFTTKCQLFAALGKLAVHLADEMNNSAAAAAQTATVLHGQLKQLPDLLVRLTALTASSERGDAPIRAAKDWLDELEHWKEEAPPLERVERLSLIELSEREHSLLDWMAEQGLPEREELVQTLLLAGLLRRDLERLIRNVEDTTALPDLLAFLEFMLTVEATVREISSRLMLISTLVEAVTTYSHIDGSSHKE